MTVSQATQVQVHIPVFQQTSRGTEWQEQLFRLVKEAARLK